MRSIAIGARVAPALGLAALLGACGSSNSSKQASAGKTPQIQLQKTRPSGPPYHPKIAPASFTANFTNHYWPLKPGAMWTYDGLKDGQPEHVVIVVAKTPRTVYGVRCLTVVD